MECSDGLVCNGLDLSPKHDGFLEMALMKTLHRTFSLSEVVSALNHKGRRELQREREKKREDMIEYVNKEKPGIICNITCATQCDFFKLLYNFYGFSDQISSVKFIAS